MAKTGRKPNREITKSREEIFLKLLQLGDSERQAAIVTGVSVRTWHRYADRDPKFAALLEKAQEKKASVLAATVRKSMRVMIEKGHPWWTKLAIWNYPIGLIDPDRKIEELTSEANRQIEVAMQRMIAIVAKKVPAKAMRSIMAEYGVHPRVIVEKGKNITTEVKGDA